MEVQGDRQARPGPRPLAPGRWTALEDTGTDALLHTKEVPHPWHSERNEHLLPLNSAQGDASLAQNDRDELRFLEERAIIEGKGADLTAGRGGNGASIFL